MPYSANYPQTPSDPNSYPDEFDSYDDDQTLPVVDAPQTPGIRAPYPPQDITQVGNGLRWRGEIGGVKPHDRQLAANIRTSIDNALLFRAEGQVRPGEPKRKVSHTPQGDAANMVASALNALSARFDRNPTQFNATAHQMILEVGAVRNPRLEQLPNVVTGPNRNRAWDKAFEPNNLAQLVEALNKQLGNSGWNRLRSGGIATASFAPLMEHYLGLRPSSWERQLQGGEAVVPPYVIDRLDFIVRLEAAMHLQLGNDNTRRTVLDLIANVGVQPQPADPKIAYRLAQYDHYLEIGAYDIPHLKRDYGEDDATFDRRREAALLAYCNDVLDKGMPAGEERDQLARHALHVLTPISARIRARGAAHAQQAAELVRQNKLNERAAKLERVRAYLERRRQRQADEARFAELQTQTRHTGTTADAAERQAKHLERLVELAEQRTAGAQDSSSESAEDETDTPDWAEGVWRYEPDHPESTAPLRLPAAGELDSLHNEPDPAPEQQGQPHSQAFGHGGSAQHPGQPGQSDQSSATTDNADKKPFQTRGFDVTLDPDDHIG